MMEMLGTADWDFYQGNLELLQGITDAGEGADETRYNFPISVIKGIKPADQTEMMMGALMACSYIGAMQCAADLAVNKKTFSRLMKEKGLTVAERMYLEREQKELHIEYVSRLDSNQRAFKGFTRTYCMLVDTLKHYRANSHPSTTMQQVNVAHGAQAIVGGTFTHAAPQNDQQENRTAPPRALADQQQPAMPIIDNSGKKEAVPLRRKTR